MQKQNQQLGFLTLFAIGAGLLAPSFVSAAEMEMRDIIFPVLRGASYRNDWGAPRVGHTHQGNDLFAPKMRPLVAAVNGTVNFVPYPQPSYGYMISITDADGFEYWYLHMNNDTPGTDDGLGGGIRAYAPDMVRNWPVVAGQLIGWVGDSGNAEPTPSHLHFEIHRPDGSAMNPYRSLRSATVITKTITPPAGPDEYLPFGQFTGGGSIAMRPADGREAALDFVGNDWPQVIAVAAGPRGGPLVKISSPLGTPRSQFLAYESSFRGGVSVALGDVDSDGVTDVITAPGRGRLADIKIFTLDGILKSEFEAYPGFINGVNLAVADLDGDGDDGIVTGPRAGGRPWVKTYHGDGTLENEFFAYSQKFRGGIEVAASAGTPEASAAIFTVPGATGGPLVRQFRLDGSVINQFWAYRSGYRGGVNLAVGELDANSPGPEIMTFPASKTAPDFRVYGTDTTLLTDEYTAFESWWRGGYDGAISDGQIVVASGVGGRRTSVRTIEPLTPPDHWWWDGPENPGASY